MINRIGILFVCLLALNASINVSSTENKTEVAATIKDRNAVGDTIEELAGRQQDLVDAIGKKIKGCDRGEYLKDFDKCVPCQTCPVGSYISQECFGKGTQDTVECSPCEKTCPFGEYLDVCDGTATSDNSKCKACTTCGTGFYNSGMPCFAGEATSDTVVCSACPVCADGEVCLAGECVTDPGTGFAALLQWYNGSNLDLYALSPFSKLSNCTLSPTNPFLQSGGLAVGDGCDVGFYEVDCRGTCGSPQRDYVFYPPSSGNGTLPLSEGVFNVVVIGEAITGPTPYLLTIYNNGQITTLAGIVTTDSPIVTVPFDCGQCLGVEYLFVYDRPCSSASECFSSMACYQGNCVTCSVAGDGADCNNSGTLGTCAAGVCDTKAV